MAITLAPRSTLGEPPTHWSLRRLKGYLERRRVVPHSISGRAIQRADPPREMQQPGDFVVDVGCRDPAAAYGG